MIIAAVGLADSSDGRHQNDNALLQSEVRADAKSQLVEKAIGLYLERASLAKNYDRLRDRLLVNSGSFITNVMQESEPRLGKDGFLSVTTQALVNVKAVRKSLNEMSHEERIDFIRNNGDPKVSVKVAVRDADQADRPPQLSPVAENMLKERIKTFGFRTWSEDAAPTPQGKGADFAVVGEAKIKKLSAKLAASGLTVTKYTLTSWTVKCIDRLTGEELYFNTTLPKGVGSWASEEEALAAIGTKIADEFSRSFFLQHYGMSGQRVAIKIEALPDGAAARLVERELVGLPAVITVAQRSVDPGAALYDVQLAGSGAATELIANGILQPLNAKLGERCFALGAVAASK
jgi:hypothetical protein